MDIVRARHNMVEQQIRPWEVLDPEVLGLFQRCPRDAYVPEEYRALAYADTRIPLGDGQAMMLPREEARLLQGACARTTGISARGGHRERLPDRPPSPPLCRHVTSIEISAERSERAAGVLAAQGVHNVALEVGDGRLGRPDGGASYHAVALTGSVHELDPTLLAQLEVGGRLFAIVGEAPAMEARLVTRTSTDQWDTESLFETVVPHLVGAAPPRRFDF